MGRKFFPRRKTGESSQKKHKVSRYYPFKSGLEAKVAHALGEDWKYEDKGSVLTYTTESEYNPDFAHSKLKGNELTVVLEVKGYFRDGSIEARKYINVKRCNPHVEVVFVFSDPSKRAYASCRPRKDGSVQTLAEWCVKHGFLYYTLATMPPPIVNGSVTKEWLDQQKQQQARRFPNVKCH